MPKRSVYLDYAAASPVDEVVLKTMAPYWAEQFANSSGLSASSVQTKAALESARRTVASLIGVTPHQIIFTSGATEANNLAIKGVMARFPGTKILISSLEHDSVSVPATKLGAKKLPVDENGNLKLDELEKIIDDRTVLISVIHVSNELGVVQKLSAVAQIVKKIRLDRQKRRVDLPLLLHSDGAQSPLTQNLKVSRLGVDLMTLSAGKIYGPKGVGCLYVHNRRMVEPEIEGGGQELGLRSGTEPLPLIIGFATALELIDQQRDGLVNKFRQLKTELFKTLDELQPDVGQNGKTPDYGHITSLQIPGGDGEALTMALDQLGVVVATGAACAASADKPSAALKAIGLNDAQANASLRISFGKSTTVSEVINFVKKLKLVRDQLS